jgi:hypothetical protein
MVERRPGLLRILRLIWSARSRYTREDIERAADEIEREEALSRQQGRDNESEKE